MKNKLSKIIWILFPIMNNIFSLLTIKIISYTSEISEFGEFNLIKSLVLIFTPIISMGLPQALIRFIPIDNNKKRVFLSNILKLSNKIFIIGSIISGLIIYLSRGLLDITFITISTVISISLYMYFQNYGNILVSIERAELNLRSYNLYTFFSNIIFIIVFISIKRVYNVINSFYISYSIAYILMNILYILRRKYIDKTVNVNFNIENIREIFEYGIPMVGINLAGIILSVGDRFVLNYFVTISEVGLYSGLYSIANGIWSVIFMLISSYLSPMYIRLYKQSGEEAVKIFINKIFNLLLSLTIGATIFMGMFNKEVIGIFLNKRYYGDGALLVIIFIGNILYGFYYLATTEYHLIKNTKILMKCIVFTGILNMVFNILFVPIWGCRGAGLATILAYIILVALTYKKQKLIVFRINHKMNFLNIMVLATLISIVSTFKLYSMVYFFLFLIIYLFIYIIK